jgi:20S proteasome alpha/beta subunit
MTTIAWDGKVLACDSRWSDDNVQVISRTKICRLPSGALYGGAGSCDDRELLAMLAKVKKPDQLPTLAQLGTIRQDLAALFILPNRKVFVVGTCNVSPGEDESEECGVVEYDAPCAIGSGALLALAVMKYQIKHGKADAYEAVKIAADLDQQSGPPVHRLTLHPQNGVRRK